MNVGMRRHLTPSNSSPRENCAGITGSRCAPNANATLIPVAIVVLRPRRADEDRSYTTLRGTIKLPLHLAWNRIHQ